MDLLDGKRFGTRDERLEVHVQEGRTLKKNEVAIIIDVHASHKTDRVLDELRGPIPCTGGGRGCIVRYVAPGTTGKCQVIISGGIRRL